MKIALLEHFTSLPRGTAPASLRREGGAILAAVAADLEAVPGVATEVAGRHGVGESGFDAVLSRCDAALVLAPEEDGILERLTRHVVRRGRVLLGPGPRAVRLAADKQAASRCLEARGIPVPWGRVVGRRDAAARLRRMEPPFVVKPRDGCGCQGVSVVRASSDIAWAVTRAGRASRRRDLLVEEHVAGQPASVSVLVSRGTTPSARPQVLGVALNRQDLRGRRALRYEGGETPFCHPQSGEAMRLAARAVEAIASRAPDLAGYVGVDLVLSPDGPRVIEINPRLTTSYLGLRHVARASLAALMLDAALGRPLPRTVGLRGRCVFCPGGRVRPAAPRATEGGRCRSIAAGTSAASI